MARLQADAPIGRLLCVAFCLYDELHVALHVAVVVVVVADGAEAVGEGPHLHGAVGAAGEHVIGRRHLHLHDARAEVPEQRLASVFVGEGEEQRLRGQAPNLSANKSQS